MMASVFKKSYWGRDRKTGKRVKKRRRKWYIKYRDAQGVLRRVPGYTDKGATLQKAAELERQAELEASGIRDPFAKHRRRPLTKHVADFEKSLLNKGDTAKHALAVGGAVRKIITSCRFKVIDDISASQIDTFLSEMLTGPKNVGIRTRNHYLGSFKQFCRWLVLDRRTGDNPVLHLRRMNSQTDRRHDRRALSAEEFARLIDAAESGPPVQSVSGSERAMLYILACWTGFRRKELASLTRRSLDLDGDPPTVSVQASYSKRRRLDSVPLHPGLVARLRDWIAANGKEDPDQPLFALRTPSGKLRRTSKMMKRDLERARATWIAEAATEEERARRKDSSFLAYRDADGLFADFHANRHTFITNLCKAGVSPRTAQELARHSTITLTMGIYTHIALNDQAAAVESLPAPPSPDKAASTKALLKATGTEG